MFFQLLSTVKVTMVAKIMKSAYCPRRDFTQKAKSRGGTLVTRAYIKPIKESTYSSNIQSYGLQYRKNLDLLEQGPRGIGR